MAIHVVGLISDFPPGSRKIVTIANRSIGVFHVNGEFFALRNRCPHAGAPLCEGGLGGLARSSEPGKIDYTRSGEFIRCPWHSWEFDLRTGQSWFDPARVRVKTYQTSVGCRPEADGAPPAGDDDDSSKPLLTVETYPVTTDDLCVRIEI